MHQKNTTAINVNFSTRDGREGHLKTAQKQLSFPIEYLVQYTCHNRGQCIMYTIYTFIAFQFYCTFITMLYYFYICVIFLVHHVVSYKWFLT